MHKHQPRETPRSRRWKSVFTGIVLATSAIASGDLLPAVIDLAETPGSEGARVQRIYPSTGTEMGPLGQRIAVGDFDGDNLDDVAVGYSEHTVAGQISAGLVRIFFGISLLDAGPEAADSTVYSSSIVCGNGNAKFGFSLTAANLDDDAADELIVGAPGARSGKGMVFAFPEVPTNGTVAVHPDLADSSVGEVRFVGLNNGDLFGYAVAAGDTTGDGKAEIVASALNMDNGATADAGKVFVFFSGFLTFNTTQTATLVPWRWEIRGAFSGSYLGYSLAMGDVTGDGLQDILIGAPFHQPDSGAAFLIPAPPQSLFFPTVDDPNALSGMAQFVGDQLFGVSVAMGDTDGDGSDELLFGAPGFDWLKTDAGQAILMPGSINLIGNFYSFVAHPPGTHGETRFYGDETNGALGGTVAFSSIPAATSPARWRVLKTATASVSCKRR